MMKTRDARLDEPARIMHAAAVQVPMPSRRASGLLIDAHVHAHPCFHPAAFFNHAAGNFARAKRESNAGQGAIGCLLLAENPTDDFFESLKCKVEVNGWRIEPTKESCSLVCRREVGSHADDVILLIAGRQIVARDGLEVLALCCERRFPVGRSLKSTLEQVIRAGAVTVLPWGFGKWWRKRGALVRKVIESGFSSSIWLGDNGNRLAFAPRPRMFALAVRRGVPILPGSDPLPMKGRERDVGRCGFHLDGSVDLDRPAQWIKSHLKEKRARGEAIRPFGGRERFARFCISQIAMQLRNRA